MEYGSIVFDMDGVILDFTGDDFKWKYDKVREGLEEMGVDASDFSRSELDAFLGDKGLERFLEVCERQEIDARKTWELIAVKTTEARAEMMSGGSFQLYPEVDDVLEKVSSVRLGLISNAPEMAVRSTVNFYDLKTYFNFFRGITDFDDFPSRKPQPDHLEIARAELKMSPFIYVGDAESDIIAARKAGMKAVWVNRNGASVDVRPDFEVNDLSELVDIVDGEA